MSYTCKQCKKNVPASEKDIGIYRFTHTCGVRGFHNMDSLVCSDFDPKRGIKEVLITNERLNVERFGAITKTDSLSKRVVMISVSFLATVIILIVIPFLPFMSELFTSMVKTLTSTIIFVTSEVNFINTLTRLLILLVFLAIAFKVVSHDDKS